MNQTIIIENRNGKWLVNYKEYKDLNEQEKSLINGFFKAMKIQEK